MALMNARETMLMAAQLCREVAEQDYRSRGLAAHATGAELCARVLEIRAEGLPAPDIATELLAARAKLEAAEKLAEAVSFYADKNGDGYDVMVTNYGLSTDEGPIVQDGGDIARAALAAWGAAQ